MEKLIEPLRKGDILVVTRLDRLARSTSELRRMAEHRTERSAGLQSLDEPWADTTSPSGRLAMTIFAGIAEFEHTLIISRTSDGRLAAKARGVTFGRPKKMRPDQQELARELVRHGKSISAVARTFNVHPATIHRVLEGKEALCRCSVPLSRIGPFGVLTLSWDTDCGVCGRICTARRTLARWQFRL